MNEMMNKKPLGRTGLYVTPVGFGVLTVGKTQLNYSVSEGAALLRFGERLGIAREQIMAFGDGRNDCDMIRAAGVGVAMANACDELKAVADRETLSNEEDGVAWAIEHWALGK